MAPMEVSTMTERKPLPGGYYIERHDLYRADDSQIAWFEGPSPTQDAIDFAEAIHRVESEATGLRAALQRLVNIHHMPGLEQPGSAMQQALDALKGPNEIKEPKDE